jgi:hypothetical protein
MKDLLDFFGPNQDPLIIIIGLIILYAVRDFGAKLKKIDHIDVLVTEVGSLVGKVQDLINSQAKSRSEVDNQIEAIKLDIRLMQDRILKLELSHETK